MTDIMVIELCAALQSLVDKCPAWATALREAHAVNGGVLTVVIYHDEIMCGNVLAVIKRKKITAMYLCFKEMLDHMHLEQAWIPCMKGKFMGFCVWLMGVFVFYLLIYLILCFYCETWHGIFSLEIFENIFSLEIALNVCVKNKLLF